MDAMVFFAAAMVVSSILLSYESDSRPETEARPYPDPSEALGVFLKASIGSDAVLSMADPVSIRAGDLAGECLLVELCGLSDGLPEDVFDPLNDLLSRMLSDICAPWAWHLSASADAVTVLLELGCSSITRVQQVFAGSAELADAEGRSYLVVLSISSCAC
jgi:hypothetical protein